MSTAHQLGLPHPLALCARAGRPTRIGDVPVEAVREEWLVEDGWWTGRPLRRGYFELVLADGRNLVVFQDLTTGSWFTQRD